MSLLATTISASKARSNFYTILNEVNGKLKRFTITLRGEAQAVIMHPEEVAAWEETMEILSDRRLMKDIASAKKEIASGKTISEKRLAKKLGIN